MKLLATVLIALLCQSKPVLQFEAPDKAKPDELKKAAEALQARCKAFGYEDVTISVVNIGKGQGIEVKRKEGLTEQMQARVKTMATIAAAESEIAFGHRLSKAEEDMYDCKNGKPGKDKKAPKGMKWVVVPFRSNTATFDYEVLIREGVRLEAAEIELRDTKVRGIQEDLVAYFVKDSAQAKWKTLDAGTRSDQAYLILDGIWHHFAILAGQEDGKFLMHSVQLGGMDSRVILKNPLPFSLKLQE